MRRYGAWHAWPPRLVRYRSTSGASSACPCSLPGVCLDAFDVEIGPVTVVDHDRWKILHLQAPDRLGAEILVGDDLGFLDEARQHGARATDRPEVHRLVLLQRVLHQLRPPALADRAFEAEPHEARRVLVHASTRGRADRSDYLAGARRC